MAEPNRSVDLSPTPVPGGIAARALGARSAAYLDDLNPEQREAVETLELPGAGAGRRRDREKPAS